MAAPSLVGQGSGGPTGPAIPGGSSQRLMTELCNKTGLFGSKFDAEGQITLQFDTMQLTFIAHGSDSISVICYVGEIGKNENMIKLMQLNFLPGAGRFAVEPNSTRAVAVHCWDTKKIAPDEFCNGVEAFLNRAEKGQKLLASK